MVDRPPTEATPLVYMQWPVAGSATRKQWRFHLLISKLCIQCTKLRSRMYHAWYVQHLHTTLIPVCHYYLTLLYIFMIDLPRFLLSSHCANARLTPVTRLTSIYASKHQILKRGTASKLRVLVSIPLGP